MPPSPGTSVFVYENILQNQHPRCLPLSPKVTSRISYLHLAISKAQMVKMEALLQYKSPFTPITSWLPSPIPREFLCPSCNQFPVNRVHRIILSNRRNH